MRKRLGALFEVDLHVDRLGQNLRNQYAASMLIDLNEQASSRVDVRQHRERDETAIFRGVLWTRGDGDKSGGGAFGQVCFTPAANANVNNIHVDS